MIFVSSVQYLKDLSFICHKLVIADQCTWMAQIDLSIKIAVYVKESPSLYECRKPLSFHWSYIYNLHWCYLSPWGEKYKEKDLSIHRNKNVSVTVRRMMRKKILFFHHQELGDPDNEPSKRPFHYVHVDSITKWSLSVSQ